MEAAGLASSIITFVDFSYKLIDGSISIYQQVQGGSGAKHDTRRIIDDLQAITKHMSHSTPAPPTPHEQALASLAGHCNTLSDELVALLRSFEPKADGNKALRSLEAAFKTLRKNGKIREIEQKLDSYKLQLLLRLNMMLCESGRAVGSQIKTMQKDHSTFFSKNIQELQSVKVAVETLESKILRLAQVVTKGNTSAATADIEHPLSLNQIQLDLACLKEVIAALPQQTPTHFHVLDRLNFDRLYSRVDSVQDGQFDRFLSRLESKELGAVIVQARDAVRVWGTNGGIVLHISGKPGSGKSTLMKLLSQNEGLHDTLTAWAGEKKLVVASFFFWNAGSPLQSSFEGLYRSVLFQVLRQCPDLADHVFPQSKHQSPSYEQRRSSATSYRQSELRNAMGLLIQSFSEHGDYRLCLFVDGLDELDGKSHDYQKLAKQLGEWANNPHVRICASSRPYHEFHHVFSKVARINLHELTDPDIYDFSHKILMDSNDGHLNPEEIDSLAREITDGSEGVFLWARVVAQTLSEGILHEDSHRSLKAKIHNTPKDLTDFLLHLFQSISPEDRARAYLLLLTLKEWPTQSFNAIAVSWMEDLEDSDFPYNRPRCVYTDEQVGKRIQYAERQLKLVCKGLLELRNDGHEKDIYFGQRIEFFHRTALDFVRQPEIVSAMQQHLGNRTFSPPDYHMRLRLAELKFARLSYRALASFDGPVTLRDKFMGVCQSARGSSRALGECDKILRHYQEEAQTQSVAFVSYAGDTFMIGGVHWGALWEEGMKRGSVFGTCLDLEDDGGRACSTFSFLHHSAHIGASAEFVMEAFASGEPQLSSSCPHLCLILSTIWGRDYCDLDLLGRLLNAGARLSERVLLHDRKDDAWSLYVPGWVAFLAWLGNYSAQNWHRGWDQTRLQDERKASGPFSVLQLLLCQQRELDADVRMEFYRLHAHEMYKGMLHYGWADDRPEYEPLSLTLTLEELVLRMRPANMDVLLQDLQARKSWAGRAGSLAMWALSAVSPRMSATSGTVEHGLSISESTGISSITDKQRKLLATSGADWEHETPKFPYRLRRMWVGGTMYSFWQNPSLRVY